MVKQILGARRIRASFLIAASAGLLATQSAQAGINSPNLVFPPRDSTLQMEPTKIDFPNLQTSITGLSFAPTNNGVPLSTSSETDITTWPLAGDLDFTSNGVPMGKAINAKPFVLFTADQSGTSFTFKLVAVKTISWSYDDESPKEARISPTNPSTGELDYTQLADGSYDISCTINLNLQVSADGGSTWVDGSSPMRLDLVPTPEPSSVVLLGALPVALLRRRRRMTT